MTGVMIILLLFISTILTFAIPYFQEYTVTILKWELILYILMVLVDMRQTKQFNLFHTWIASFIFIIWSDMILIAADDPAHVYTIPIFFYLIANNLALWGYKLSSNNKMMTREEYLVTHPRYMFALILIGIVSFLYIFYDNIILTLGSGRILNDAKGGTTLTGSIASALGLILPALITYYFRYVKKKSWIYSILLSLPILVFQAIIATRFKLLFQIIPLFIMLGVIKVKDNTIKSLMVLTGAVIAIGVYSSYTKENRNYAINEQRSHEQRYTADTKDDIFLSFAEEMSPEGIIHMAHLANDYFEKNSLSYGRESLTIFYFWIPRSWWPEKPTQLDYWLIRKYENMPDAHSTSSGFLGELRADFGWISIIFALFIGIVLRRCDQYIQSIFSNQSHSLQMVFAAMLYPYFFFFVRSPLTASFSLIFCYFIYWIIRKTMCKRVINIPSQS